MRAFMFWLRTSSGDVFVDRRIGNWPLAREYADGLQARTGERVFFYQDDEPQHRSWSSVMIETEVG